MSEEKKKAEEKRYIAEMNETEFDAYLTEELKK